MMMVMMMMMIIMIIIIITHSRNSYIITWKDVSMSIRSLALTLRPYFQYLEKYEEQGVGNIFPNYQRLDSFLDPFYSLK
jgi:hypothetical protein